MGNILNDLLGVSSSAKQQYKNQMNLQKDAQNFSKWQMANAHQMEVQDLQKAGLNPVLSAGGSGASAGVSEGGASTGSTAGDPISMINAIVGMINSSKQTDANVKKVKADIRNETKTTDTNADNSTKLTEAQINNLNANTGKTNYDTNLNKDNNINANTPYPIKILNSARASVKREKKEWDEKAKQKGWNGWKYKARKWIFNQ